ncbi:cupin domain-containing protein [Marinicella sediminis]|uniref:Cupin domain-containing protein n=1 Tax=Marinicella sediminis TaxID=1792834 RepID=A0ABV7JET8_9GAMM|nr:cupin domain-containing protein [Marinicella sediminis]
MPKTKPNVFDDQDITASEFFSTHWQSSPYLFRNTSVNLDCLPDATDLFALAEQEGVQSRIVFSEDQHSYQAIYDEPEAWNDVAACHPTLLVSDIEKWFPSASQLLQWFPFIKSWRFDDLMMSFAPKGASVGAHTDHYDVFLVQVKGTRRWSWDDRPLPDSELVSDSELAVIADYHPQHTAELKPGDILYLPPEIPHHGISTSDDCLTCSIGLRAPADEEMLNAVVELITLHSAPSERFKDGVQSLQSNASIGRHEVNYLRQHLTDMSQMEDSALAELFGQVVTSYRLFDELPQEEDSPQSLDGCWQKSPFSIFAYHIHEPEADALTAELFVNGEVFVVSAFLPPLICDQQTFTLQAVKQQSPKPMNDLRVIRDLIDMQALIRT